MGARMSQYCNCCKNKREDRVRACSWEAFQTYSVSFWAEAFGMAFYCFMGVGAQVLGEAGGVDAAFAFAFTAAVMIYVTAHRSGGHLNPAVTLSYMLTGHCYVSEGIVMIFGQVLGALGGLALLWWTTPEDAFGAGETLGANKATGIYDDGDDANWIRVAVAEGLCMFMILLVYYEVGLHSSSISRTSRESRPIMAPIAIGVAIYAAHSLLIHIDGCSVNPAKSVGAALLETLKTINNVDGAIWGDLTSILSGHGIAVVAMIFMQNVLKDRGAVAGSPDGIRTKSMFLSKSELPAATEEADATAEE